MNGAATSVICHTPGRGFHTARPMHAWAENGWGRSSVRSRYDSVAAIAKLSSIVPNSSRLVT